MNLIKTTGKAGAARGAALLAIIALLALAVPALAQEVPPGQRQVTADDVNAVAKRMYCAVCENVSLDVCPTLACAQWRDEIRIQLEAGYTPDEVIADFVARYGDRAVGLPQDPTLRALSLATPLAITALVLAGTAYTLLRWRRGRGAGLSPAGAAPPDDDYRARLEQDLKARR